MTFRRLARFRWLRGLGTGFLVASLMHTPLPKADFHNIRHHDAPGEACPLHEHLLRWHPEAFGAADVAVLHWHWFLPMPGSPETDSAGASVHSQLPDWSGLAWDDAPQITPSAGSRLIGPPASDRTASPSFDAGMAPATILARAGPSPTLHTFGATFAPRVSLASLLNRWIC